MLWRNLKTQFITRFFRIRHDNKMFLYFNVCNSSCSTLYINRQLNIITRPSWILTNRVSLISCIYRTLNILLLKWLTAEFRHPAPLQVPASWASWASDLPDLANLSVLVVSTSLFSSQSILPGRDVAIFLKLYIKYFRTVPVVVVVVHCLMALKDQISVKSLAVIVKCLKFCRAGCHNERTLKLNPI